MTQRAGASWRVSIAMIGVVLAACQSRASAQTVVIPQPERLAFDEMSAILGVLAFDTLGGSQRVSAAGTRWFAADTVTYRALLPTAISRGLHFDILPGTAAACPWNTSDATRPPSSILGLEFKVSTRIDSAGFPRADVRMSCFGPVVEGGRPNRGNFGTGIVVELVKSGGKWRIARVVDRWVT